MGEKIDYELAYDNFGYTHKIYITILTWQQYSSIETSFYSWNKRWNMHRTLRRILTSSFFLFFCWYIIDYFSCKMTLNMVGQTVLCGRADVAERCPNILLEHFTATSWSFIQPHHPCYGYQYHPLVHDCIRLCGRLDIGFDYTTVEQSPTRDRFQVFLLLSKLRNGQL